MKIALISLFILSAGFNTLNAQTNPEQSKTEKLEEPDFKIARDPTSWSSGAPGLQTSFVSTNLHYDAVKLPKITLNKQLMQSGWKNEVLNCEVLLWSKQPVSMLSVAVTPFTGSNGLSLSKDAQVCLIKNVISELSAGKCGNTDNKTYDPLLIPDLIEDASTFNLAAYTCRSVLITLKIPSNAAPGVYQSKITFKVAGALAASDLNWTVRVAARTIPENKNEKFFLNIWQNPYQVASYNKVAPWSDEHFNLLKPAMSMLADAGQKCITASFFWDSFNSYSKGLSNAMIISRKQKDGSWIYDYNHFDKWTAFMMALGIKDEIAIFGLDPWYPNLWYWDESLQHEVNLKAIPGSPEYTAFWTPLLKDFRDHLVKKGWLNLVAIAIDERSFNNIKSDISFVRSIDKRFRFQVSGQYNPLLEPDIYDYALNSNQVVPKKTIEIRKRAHKVTSYYTACWEIRPNSLITNEPGDSWFLPLHSMAVNMDGFSRYASTIWSMNNLKDARNTDVPPGDAFFIYPGSRTSLRFEKLKEGITSTVKLSLLLKEARSTGNKAMETKLLSLLDKFKAFESPSDSFIGEEEAILNQF